MRYLDHAATTPMLGGAIEAVQDELGRLGNPSSLHTAGRQARRRVEEAREELAAALGARPSEVIFTSGGTEADNLAIKGISRARVGVDDRRRRLLIGATEHHAVLDAAKWCQSKEQAEITWLEVDEQGLLAAETLRAAIADDPDSVALASVMWANNEIGTLAPVAELAAVAHEFDIPFHTDAVQAIGAVPVDFAACGGDALALSGHKFGGPAGVGALLLRRDVACEALLHGGGQERDLRSGTPNVAGVAGMARAASIAVNDLVQQAARLAQLRQRLIAGVRDQVPDVVVNGHPSQTLPGVVSLSFPGCQGDSLLMLLDGQGIACSTGSACDAGVARASHVLLATGVDEVLARGSLRFSLGHTSEDADVDAVIATIGAAVERARRAGITSVLA